MALSSVLPGSYFGDAVSQNGYGFEYLGKLYLFTYRPTEDITISPPDDRHFRCMRSSDAGASWAEVGGPGPQWPFTLGGTVNAVWPVDYTVARDGNNAILLWVNAEKDVTHLSWSNFSISKVVFNLTTGIWGSVTTTAAPFMGMMDVVNQSPATDHSNRTAIYLIVRGPSDYLVYVPGAESGASPSLRGTATVVTYNGSSFGGAMPIPGQVGGKWYMPCGSVYDPASGNTHFLMAGGIAAGGQPNVYHVAMDSGNSYGSVTTVIDSSTSPGDINAATNTGPDGVSQPIIYSDGVTRKVAFVSSVFSTSPFPVFVRFFSATEALNPAFTHSEISTDQAIAPLDIPNFGVHAEVFSLAASSTTLITTWISFNGVPDQPSDIYYSTSPATGTPVWSTPISVIPTPAALPATGGGISPYVLVQGLAFPVTGGFGIVGMAQQYGNYAPFFVSKFSFVAAGGGGGGMTVDCNDPPDGALGDPYSHPLTITGAPAGSTVAITGGALPPGLTIDDTGRISGTPTLGGSYTYTATVTPPALLRSTRSVITLPDYKLGWDFKQCPNAPIPGAIGGYEYSGVQYLFLWQGGESPAGDFDLHALKSTDLGVTWTDTGSIFIPNNAGSGHGLPTYTTCMDGTTIYVMGVDLVGAGETTAQPNTGPVLLYKYNLLTSSFGAGSTPSGAPTVSKGWAGTSYPPRSGVGLHLLRRGAGDMLLLYTGVETIGANKYARIYVASFNGTSCGAGTVLPGQAGVANAYIERCAGFDASHNLHVILSWWTDYHFLYHIAMDSGGSFGTFQTIETDAYYYNDTSNLLDFSAPADTIAFLAVRNRSSSGANGDLAIYSAPGGSLTPTWTFHNLPSTANAVQDPYLAPDWIGGLGYLDGTLHAFWTQTGVPPGWSISAKTGQIHSSTAVATDLTTWTAETSVIGPFDGSGLHWGAMQVGVWAGTAIGLGVVANFEGYDDAVGGTILESSYLLVYPPDGGGGTIEPASVTCTTTVGYGHLSTSCGAPPVYTQGVAGAPYRPPVVMGEIGLPPVYDLNHTLIWTFPPFVPPGFHWETNPASENYGYLVGTPTSVGVQNFTYTVHAPDGQSVTNTCPLTVEPGDDGGGGGGGGGGPLNIFCDNPPGGKVGIPYNHTFPVVGATGPTTYSVVVGALPPGVHLDPATGDLTGTPTAPGTYSFSIKVQQ